MSKKTALEIWLAFFFYAVVVSLFVQLVLLVYIRPSWSSGHGLISSLLDSATFHRLADEMAQNIRAQGWSAWSLKPEGQAPVGVIAAIYALTFSEPWTLIPLHAFLHATAAFLLLQIVRSFVPDVKKAVICSLPFLLYPSAATWYAQIHKDGYFILGFFLVVYSLILLLSDAGFINLRSMAKSFFYLALGTALVAYARPYLLKGLSLIEYAVLSVIFIRRVSLNKEHVYILRLGLIFFVFAVCVYFFPRVSGLDLSVRSQKQEEPYEAMAVPVVPVASSMDREVVAGWQPSSVVPRKFVLPFGLQDDAEVIIQLRNGYIEANTKARAGSGIDNDIRFNDALDIVLYLPRAMQIALFAPFPRDWWRAVRFESSTFMRRIGGLEMLGVYFALFFLPYAVWRWRRQIELWIILSFCMSLLALQGLVINNVGTLYRLRYGMLMLLVAMGIAGFIALREKRCAE